MEVSKFRGIKLFANSGGSMSWRCLNPTMYFAGGTVDIGYYKCDGCGSVVLVDRFNETGDVVSSQSNILEQCKFCGVEITRV
jgi:hypothetical protein